MQRVRISRDSSWRVRQVYWKTFLGDHALLPSPASTGLEFAFGVSFSPRLGNPSIRTCFGPKKRGRSMELYSYDYALKALWLYTSEPEWASNWSSFERRRASTLIMMLARTGSGRSSYGNGKVVLGRLRQHQLHCSLPGSPILLISRHDY